MKAVYAVGQGQTAELKLDAPKPAPADNEILVKVFAAGVNPVDNKLITYNFTGLSFPRPIGCDFSGRIEAVGANVKGWAVGDEVFSQTDYWNPTSFAEYLTIDPKWVARKPASLSHVEAAAFPIAFLSAWEGLNVAAQVYPNDTVYIAAAAGGVGHFATQIAKIKGAKVIATASKPENFEYLRSIGVDHVIDHSKSDVAAEILRLTDGQGVDLVYEPSYVNSSLQASAKVVKKGGVFVELGSTTDSLPDVLETIKQRGGRFVQVSLPPLYYQKQADHFSTGLSAVQDLVRKGLKVQIRKVITLEEAPQEMLEVMKGASGPGKSVIRIVNDA